MSNSKLNRSFVKKLKDAIYYFFFPEMKEDVQIIALKLLEDEGISISVFSPEGANPLQIGDDLGEGYVLASVTKIVRGASEGIPGHFTYGVMVQTK